MTSPPLNADTPESCTLKLSYYSNTGSSWKVFIANDAENKLWIETQPSRGVWRNYSVPIGVQNKGFQVSISGLSKTRYETYLDLFLDNFEFVNCDPNQAEVLPDGSTPAPGQTASVYSVSCAFEESFCGWINVNRYATDRRSNWKLLKTTSIEPGNDHTSLLEPKPLFSGGWIGIIDNDNLNRDYLRTEFPLDSKKTYCFSFWYYFMDQSTRSSIQLYRSSLSTAGSSMDYSKDYVKLWNLETPVERNWKKSFIQLDQNETNQYLFFVSYSSSYSSIGLDDFVLREGTCEDEDIGENCDFDSSTCGWKIKNKEWIRQKGDLQDHTTNTRDGGVLKFTGEAMKESSISITFANSSYFKGQQNLIKNSCMKFYFYMHITHVDDDEGKTFVGIRSKEASGHDVSSKNITAVEVEDAVLGDKWMSLKLDTYLHIDSVIEIYAQKETDDTVIAIDDITFGPFCQTEGNCNFETGKPFLFLDNLKYVFINEFSS